MTVKPKPPLSVDMPIPNQNQIRKRFADLFPGQPLSIFIDPCAEEAERMMLECLTQELRTKITLKTNRRKDWKPAKLGYRCSCNMPLNIDYKYCPRCGSGIEWK